jgi:hypothetical protein
VLSFVFSASSQPTVYELVIKAMLDTMGGGIFHRKNRESLLFVDHITGHSIGHWFIKATMAGTCE